MCCETLETLWGHFRVLGGGTEEKMMCCATLETLGTLQGAGRGEQRRRRCAVVQGAVLQLLRLKCSVFESSLPWFEK